MALRAGRASLGVSRAEGIMIRITILILLLIIIILIVVILCMYIYIYIYIIKALPRACAGAASRPAEGGFAG